MSKNSKLVALIFNEGKRASIIVGSGAAVTPIEGSTPDQAIAVLETIQKSAKEANVKLEDAVVVFKNLDGDIKIKQTKDITTGKGAGWGSLWSWPDFWRADRRRAIGFGNRRDLRWVS